METRLPLHQDLDVEYVRILNNFFDGMCPRLDTFLIVSRIEFVVSFFCFCAPKTFWRRFIRGSRAGESQSKTASCSRVLGDLHSAACCAQPHVFVAPFPRAKRSFGARGALVRFIVALVALDLVGQSEDSSSSGDAKRSLIARTAAIG